MKQGLDGEGEDDSGKARGGTHDTVGKATADDPVFFQVAEDWVVEY